MPDADRFTLPDLASLAPPPSTSGRCASSRKRANTTPSARTSRCRFAPRPTAARWPPSTRTAATATPRPATLRPPACARRSSARQPGRARPRSSRCSTSRTLPRPGRPRRIRVAVARRRQSPSRRDWFDLLMRESRAAAIDPRIVDWETSMEVRHATHRLVTSEGGDLVQRYRFLFPGMSVTAHADGDTQTRTLYGYRGICQQGGGEILARFGFDGAARRIADEALELVARAELPDRHDGRAADARPDDPADPRVDRASAGARPDPRRRAQLRRHELRHARHVRHATATARICSTSRSTPRAARSSRATAGTTTARAAEKVHLIRNGILERPLGGAISQARAGLAGHVERARRRLEPAADRPHGEPQPRAGRRVARRHDRRHRARRADGDQQLVVDRRLAQQVPVRLRARAPDRERQAARSGEEPQLPRHQRELLAQPRASRATPTRCRCWARRTAARASRRRRSASAMRRRRACSRTSLSSAEKHDGAARTDGRAIDDGRLLPRARRAARQPLATGETYTAWFSAEASDFVRMNRGKVRQPGSVVQRYLDIDLIRGARHATLPRLARPATSPPIARRSPRRSAPRAPRCPRSPTIRIC